MCSWCCWLYLYSRFGNCVDVVAICNVVVICIVDDDVFIMAVVAVVGIFVVVGVRSIRCIVVIVVVVACVVCYAVCYIGYCVIIYGDVVCVIDVGDIVVVCVSADVVNNYHVFVVFANADVDVVVAC